MEECSADRWHPPVCTVTEIYWGPDDYSVIADLFVCTSSGWQHSEFWSEDTDFDGLDDATEAVMSDCQAGGGGALD
jgi:hypothetical protein